MNSKERHELRYQRRKKKREEKLKRKFKEQLNWKNVIGIDKLIDSFNLCRKGVNWKSSVQSFGINLFTNVVTIHKKLKTFTWKSKGFVEFTICERGKIRHIKSVDISERVIVKSLSRNSIIPILQDSLIYDNSATIKGRGTDFQINRLKHHLKKHFHKYGRKGGVLLFDFTNYFANIDNLRLCEIVKSKVLNDKIFNLYSQLIMYYGTTGLGLGSEICQISAVYYPNIIDHWIKNVLGIKCYGRYNDDGYIIHENTTYLKILIKELKEKLLNIGIILNEKKTRILKLTDVITFLKKRFLISDTGNISCRIGRKMIKSQRNKLRKLLELYENYEMKLFDVLCQVHGWLKSIMRYNSYKTRMNMIDYFNSLFSFHGVILLKKKYRNKCKNKQAKNKLRKCFIITKTDTLFRYFAENETKQCF